MDEPNSTCHNGIYGLEIRKSHMRNCERQQGWWCTENIGLGHDDKGHHIMLGSPKYSILYRCAIYV